VKLAAKAVLTRNFFATLRTTDMNMETIGAMHTLPDQESPRKSIVAMSTTNLI
jgi:hypothetical protein